VAGFDFSCNGATEQIVRRERRLRHSQILFVDSTLTASVPPRQLNR
jgi:hypothetical protein